MTRRWQCGAWSALLAMVFAPQAGAEAHPGAVVDRLVAVVESLGGDGSASRILTAYELDVESRLTLAERARDVEAARAAPTQGLHREVLESVLDELLVECEAARLELVSVDDDAIQSQREISETRLGGAGSLERFRLLVGAPEDLIAAILRRRAIVSTFIETNVSLAVRVSDSELEAVFSSGEHPFGNRPLERIRDELEAFVMARRQRARLSSWLDDIRRRSRVRVLTPETTR